MTKTLENYLQQFESNYYLTDNERDSLWMMIDKKYEVPTEDKRMVQILSDFIIWQNT